MSPRRGSQAGRIERLEEIDERAMNGCGKTR